MCGTYSLPRLWKKKIPLSWHSVLGKWLNLQCMLVLELCCTENSAVSQVCHEKGVPYLGFTLMQKVQDCVAFLRTILHAAVSRKGHIAVWISSPCTAGSKMRFLNLFKRWRERYRDHVTIWKAIRKLEWERFRTSRWVVNGR